MSSAILYVAIVAIWAGVLIPRWLRRDSAGNQQASEDLTSDGRRNLGVGRGGRGARSPAAAPGRYRRFGSSRAPPGAGGAAGAGSG